MKIVRIRAGNQVKYGILDGNTVKIFRGRLFPGTSKAADQSALDGRIYPVGAIKLLAPCTPSKIVCLGLNYRRHAEEIKMKLPDVPLLFLKPPTTVIGPEDDIVLPSITSRVDYEGELAIVIGRKAKDLPEERANDFILGYTCINDVSDRDAQRDDVQWTRAKGYDTFAPIGPWIETELKPDDLKIETWQNGQLRQSSRTSDLLFPVRKLVRFISGVMTLVPGDVIATGTPEGIGQIFPGDSIEIRIEGIGTLRNGVLAKSDRKDRVR